MNLILLFLLPIKLLQTRANPKQSGNNSNENQLTEIRFFIIFRKKKISSTFKHFQTRDNKFKRILSMNNKHRDIEGNDIDSWKRRYNRYLRWRVFVFKSVCIVKASVGQILSAISEPLICVCRIFLSVAAACTLCTPRGRGTLDLFAFFSPSFINPWPQPWRTSRGIRKRRARKINLAEYSYGSAVNIPTTINSGLPSWIPRSTLLLSFFAHNRSFSSYFFPSFFLSFFHSFFLFRFSPLPLSPLLFSLGISRTINF